MIEEAPVFGREHRIDQMRRHVLKFDVAAAKAFLGDDLIILGQNGDFRSALAEAGLQRVFSHQWSRPSPR